MKAIYAAAALVVLGLISVVVWVPGARVVGITALVMLGVGSTAALIWWRLADTMFPGAGRKTGQEIRLGRAGSGSSRAAGARVIREFGEAGQDGLDGDGPAVPKR